MSLKLSLLLELFYYYVNKLWRIRFQVVTISLNQFDTMSNSFKNFFSLESFENMNKIHEKILLTINQGVTGQKEQSSAVIPLMELNLITFVYLNKISESLFGLSFTIDSKHQLRLYKCIPLLEKLSNDFFNEMKDNPKIFQDFNGNTEIFQKYFDSIQKISSEFLNENLTTSTIKSPLRNLIQLLGEGINIFYRALLLNDKTVIFAEKESSIENLPWNDLVPHRMLKIIAFPKDPKKENDFDIMIIDPNLKKECDADCVIVDLSNGHTENGKTDKYLENFFDYLKEIPESDLTLEINLEINNIFKWVNEIIEVSTTEKFSNEKIKELIKFHTKTKYGDRLPLITSIARKYNEYASEHITAYFLKELGIFAKDVKRIDSKKLLSKL